MGHGANQPSAIFTARAAAEKWISDSQVSGALTAYPLDQPVYEWAVSNEFFTPKEAYQRESSFIGRFSSAYLEHYHYSDGKRAEEE